MSIYNYFQTGTLYKGLFWNSICYFDHSHPIWMVSQKQTIATMAFWQILFAPNIGCIIKVTYIIVMYVFRLCRFL